MDGLREGIYLRSYGQKDPLVEYKAEAYDMFSQLMASIKNEVLYNLFRSTTNLMAFEQFLASLPLNIPQAPELPGVPRMPAGGPIARKENFGFSNPEEGGNGESELELVLPSAKREAPKVGRNDPCPCGSGKKYKNCCGRVA